jgi:hypothetical protein
VGDCSGLHRGIHDAEAEVQGYGDPICVDGDSGSGSSSAQGALLLHLFSKFTRNFCDAIDGEEAEHIDNFKYDVTLKHR